MTKRRRDEDEEIVQFYSKSKDADDLNISIPDWRKRLSNFWPCQVEVAGRSYPSVEHAFHGGSVDRAGPCFRTNVNSPFFVACIPPPTHPSINQSINQSIKAAKARCSDKPQMAREMECGGSVPADPHKAKSAGGKGAYTRAGAKLDIARWDAERDGATMAALRARLAVDVSSIRARFDFDCAAFFFVTCDAHCVSLVTVSMMSPTALNSLLCLPSLRISCSCSNNLYSLNHPSRRRFG